jgi:hypothetical protein
LRASKAVGTRLTDMQNAMSMLYRLRLRKQVKNIVSVLQASLARRRLSFLPRVWATPMRSSGVLGEGVRPKSPRNRSVLEHCLTVFLYLWQIQIA